MMRTAKKKMPCRDYSFQFHVKRVSLMRRISSLLIKPAGPDCNLRCSYCFYTPKAALYPQARRHRLSAEVLREMVRQYMALDETPTFCWQGGEPTLMGVDFFRQVIALQKKHGADGQVVANSLQTNGTLLDDEWTRLLARYSFLVGISLDGPAEIHDSHRHQRSGGGTHAQVVGAINLLRRHRVEHNVLCMVTPRSIGRAREIVEFFTGLGLEFMQFIPCIERLPNGDLAPWTITPQAYGEFMCEVFDQWLPRREGLHVRLFEDIMSSLANSSLVSCLFRPECGEYVVVEHNGDVYACDFLVEPGYLLGNLTAQTLEDIIASAAFEHFATDKGSLSSTCRECRWLKLCHGGCQRHRLFAGGKVDVPSYLCAGYRMIFDHAVPQLQPIVDEFLAQEADLKDGASELQE